MAALAGLSHGERERHRGGPKVLLGSKRLQTPIEFPFTAYSHPHDLLAVVTRVAGQPQVQVFRILSGQMAYNIKRTDDDCAITSLAWRPDGSCLGVGWTDGKYGVYDGDSGRQMSLAELHLPELADEYALDLALPRFNRQREEAKKGMLSTVACLGFMSHDSRPHVASELGQRLATDDWCDATGEGHGDSIAKQSPEDVLSALPRAIATLDVTKLWPRPSAVPAHGLAQPSSGPGANKFSSQIATDVQFDTERAGSTNVVDALLVCQKDRTVQVLLDETVHIGTCKIAGQPLMHAAHAQSSAHAILCSSEAPDGGLALTFLHLPLDKLGGALLHLVASNTKRVQTLMDYVLQTARCIQHDYASNVVAPEKILGMLQDDLAKMHPCDGDAVTNLYHLAMTGCFHPHLLTWLDDLKDALPRRWEQPINTMYTRIRSHIFVNLLPALDRFSVAVVTLRGQASFHDGSSAFDCPPQIFSDILEHTDSLRLAAQKMQLIVMSEHREFRAFIKWLKMQVQIAGAGPFSQSALELEDQESPGIDYPLVLAYIKDHMVQSDLARHVENRPGVEEAATCDEPQFFAKPLVPTASYEPAQDVLRQLDDGGDPSRITVKDVADPVALLNLPALTCALMGRVRLALKRITEWQNRMLFPPREPRWVGLQWQAHEVLDMAATPETTRVIGWDKSAPGRIEIVTVTADKSARQSEGGPSYNQETTQHDLAGDVVDARFVPGASDETIGLVTSGPEKGHKTRVVKLRGQAQKTLYTFLPDASFRPEKLTVGGRSGKLLCVVFGNRSREWRVLDLSGLMQDALRP